jgi:hypothetical protein
MYVDLMDANIKIGRLCIFQREGFFLNLRKKKYTDLSCPKKRNNLIFASCKKKMLVQGKIVQSLMIGQST